MSDLTSIEPCLHQAHQHLAALADALARADVEQVEQIARALSESVRSLRAADVADAQLPPDDLSEAAARVHWQLERCRRLGRPFRLVPDATVPGYEPDGRSRRVAACTPTIEVLG